jgi:transposase
MPLYTPDFKQHVLEHYRAGVTGSGFAALATRFAVPGGASTVRGWHARWDGSVTSLQRQRGSGRKPILTEGEVQRHIVQPIRRSNRQHKAVHYAPLRARLIAATGKQPSLRTVQSYGHDDAVKHQRTRKRTAKERQLPQRTLLVARWCCWRRR